MVGITDVEDVLQRLDNLTQEEAHMASVELLRISHNVESGMTRVNEGIQVVDRGVRDVCDGMRDVRESVQGLDDKVYQVNRESSPNAIAPFINPHKPSQETISKNAFELGSLLQIHPQIITSHATPNTKERLDGSFAASFSLNGSPRVHSCGYTVNVRSSYHSPCHEF